MHPLNACSLSITCVWFMIISMCHHEVKGCISLALYSSKSNRRVQFIMVVIVNAGAWSTNWKPEQTTMCSLRQSLERPCSYVLIVGIVERHSTRLSICWETTNDVSGVSPTNLTMSCWSFRIPKDRQASVVRHASVNALVCLYVSSYCWGDKLYCIAASGCSVYIYSSISITNQSSGRHKAMHSNWYDSYYALSVSKCLIYIATGMLCLFYTTVAFFFLQKRCERYIIVLTTRREQIDTPVSWEVGTSSAYTICFPHNFNTKIL